jgi:hypothetical protein
MPPPNLLSPPVCCCHFDANNDHICFPAAMNPTSVEAPSTVKTSGPEINRHSIPFDELQVTKFCQVIPGLEFFILMVAAVYNMNSEVI